MSKYICTNCGFASEGDFPPTFCPQCKAPEFKFKQMDQQTQALADEHRVGVVDGISPDILEALQSEFKEECLEVGIYMAMGRQADREGLPEIANAFKKIAFEEADHASRLAEMLGETLFANTKKNLELKIDAKFKSCDKKKKIANESKQLNLDEIHDVIHEMCRDEARHYHIFKGLRERYFD